MTQRPTLDYSSATARGWIWRLVIGLAFYPALLLVFTYGTWLVAWGKLGHRPQPGTDGDAWQMGAVVACAARVLEAIFIAAWPAFVVYAALAGAIYYRSLGAGGASRLKLIAVVAMTVAPWAAGFLVLETDPGGVLQWLGLEAP